MEVVPATAGKTSGPVKTVSPATPIEHPEIRGNDGIFQPRPSRRTSFAQAREPGDSARNLIRLSAGPGPRQIAVRHRRLGIAPIHSAIAAPDTRDGLEGKAQFCAIKAGPGQRQPAGYSRNISGTGTR
jgi:hypothetical protein